MHAQAHGNRTAYAFMLDADFKVRDGWRLRIMARRMARECARRSVVECGKGLTVRAEIGNTWAMPAPMRAHVGSNAQE